MLGVACIKLVTFILAFVDVYTDNIKVVEVTDYKYFYHNRQLLLPGDETFTFTTIDGERLFGRMYNENADFPENGHGCILYAKYSHLILDFDLTE